MRIVCPSCGAAYEVPDSRVAPGKSVRCAQCTTQWAPVPPLPVPVEPERPRLEERLPLESEPAIPVPEPAPAPHPPAVPRVAPVAERLTPAPPRQRRPDALIAAWAVSLLVLGAACWGAYARRDEVIRTWPASERAYAALGITPRR